MFPYTNKKVYVVLTDIVGLLMATADPEVKKADRYLTEKNLPVIWIFTRTNIAEQGLILRKEMEALYDMTGSRRVRALWLPMHRDSSEYNYTTDVLTVANAMVKIRVRGLRRGFDPRVGLVGSWFP